MTSGNRPTNASFTVIDPPGTQVNMAPKWQDLGLPKEIFADRLTRKR